MILNFFKAIPRCLTETHYSRTNGNLLGLKKRKKKKERRAAAAAGERTKHKPLRYSRRVR
jgi:hypothetical protein